MISKATLFPCCAVLMLPTFGCSKKDHPEIQRLRWIEKADPITDAKRALSHGDHRLRAVYGLTVSIPGTDPKDAEVLKRSYGINEIDGTSDALINEEHHRLNQLATTYAEAYNQAVINAWKPKASP